MGWHEVIGELEGKLEGTLKGTYRPLDGIPFFRVQYPPSEEREALRQFRLLAERLFKRGWRSECVSLTDMFREALLDLLGCPPSQLSERLKLLEREQDRSELQERLSEYLPYEIVKAIQGFLSGSSSQDVVVLLRMGALYPFLRPSSLLSMMEGQISCVVVLPYPGTTLGAMLDAPPADPHGGYYRGEVIQ
ncbi:DUF1788 domain-containing protein [Candidatus Poribacteria bacterium]|nr:DUF1788 domain-containing protein [Candidatus Poribacteria bacterium]